MDITLELLKKYAEKECTKQEKLAVELWVDEFKEEGSSLSKDELIAIKMEMWDNMSFDMEAPMTNKHKLGIIREDPQTVEVQIYRKIIRYAAAVIVFCGISLSTYYFLNDPSQINQEEHAYIEKYRSVKTQRGEKRTVTLSDGSTIRMNYETEISVPEHFEGDERIVYLTGHAHFNVVRNPDKPFIIYTDKSKTQVLGTSFDINTKGTNETEIIVTSGKVAFSEKGQEKNLVTLKVNDRALLHADKSIATSKVNAGKLTAWKDDILVFEGETLKEIIKVLEPWYDVNITVEDSEKLSQQYNVSFNNPSFETLIEQMSFMGKFKYSLDGAAVIIY